MRNFKFFTLKDVVLYDDYHTYPFKGITERIVNENLRNCDILYWEPLEPIDDPFSYNESAQGVSEFELLLKNRDVKIYAIYSEYDIKKVEIENVYVIGWKTSLLHYCKTSVDFVYKDNVENVKINDSNFIKLFNSLNRGVRPTRITLLDSLYKNELFDFGDISWNHLTTDDPFIDMGLKFKHWNETRLKLDLEILDPPPDNQIYDTHLWSDYYLTSSCLFTVQVESIVTDHYNELHFLSEKTWKPLLLGQPFITIGSAGYYEYLKTFGFKLYDELIDYSFDSIENIEERVERIVIELTKLKNKNYNELYNKIKEKVEYNRNLSISIIKNDKYLPIELIELYKRHNKKIDSLSIFDTNMNLKEIIV